MALSTETLGSYRVRLLRELRDANQSYFNGQQGADPNVDLNAWINEATRWRDLWSGGSRAYKAKVPLQVGVDFYDLRALFGQDTVLDIINCWLIWGNFRKALTEQPLGVVTAGFRGLVTFNDVPAAFCRYGATQLVIATAPSGNYTIDLDVAVLSVTFTADGDIDPLPYPYTEPVVKYAAYLAKQNQRRFDEANIFYNEAVRALNDIEGSRVGQLPQPIGIR